MANITVSGSAQLNAALKVATAGDTILLKAGVYNNIEVNSINVSGIVNVTSAGTASSVQMMDLSFRNSSGFHFSDMQIIADSSRPMGTVEMFSSKNLSFSDLDVHGSSDKNPFNDFDGFRISKSDNISITNSKFHDLNIAIGHGDSNRVTISNNEFKYIGEDGIRGGGTSNITISKNNFSKFTHEEGVHADAIQFYPGSVNKTAKNIVITENIINQSEGDKTQGIFLRNDDSGTFEDVTISKNLIIAGNHNGIYVERVNGLKIFDNEVVSSPGYNSWIRVIEATNGVVKGNASAIYMLDTDGGVTSSNNVVNKPLLGDAADLIAGWENGSGSQGDTPLPPIEPAKPAQPSDDVVTSGASVTLSATQAALKLTGTTHVHGSGNSLANDLLGNDGNNILRGAGGDDVLQGRGGADTLDGGAGNDTASYSQAKAGVRVDLSKTVAQNTVSEGKDQLVSIENLTGSRYADSLSGDDKANVIDGGAGDDVIHGGGGADQLYGGAGADKFVFTNIDDSGPAKAARDTIYDFKSSKGDVIDLHGIDAKTGSGDQAFKVVGAFSKAAGELTITLDKDHYDVSGDVTGDGRADFTITVYADRLVAGDFIL